MLKLYPKLPNVRAFQFFVSFPAPRCSPGLDTKYIKDTPFDDHKALCGTSLYASIPPEGVTPELIEQWKITGDGLFRRDNNEFPHGLFDPAWRLKLQTVADKLQGYFYHEEIKSSGDTGQLRRKTVVSLDKHYIGKETSPLDDDNEDTQDDTPITAASGSVLRGVNRNLQPVMDIEFEEGAILSDAFLKLQRGKKLTFGDMEELKANLKVMPDGTLEPRYLKMEVEATADPVWASRIKTWDSLKRFGRFEEIAELSGVPVDDLDFAARYGDQWWHGGSNGALNIKCQNLDWAGVQGAIDNLSGKTARRELSKKARQKAQDRVVRSRNMKKLAANTQKLTELLIAVPTGISNSYQMVTVLDGDEDADDFEAEMPNRFWVMSTPEMPDGFGVMSQECSTPEIDYWMPKARKERTRLATAERVAKCKLKKKTETQDP